MLRVIKPSVPEEFIPYGVQNKAVTPHILSVNDVEHIKVDATIEVDVMTTWTFGFHGTSGNSSPIATES